MTQDSRPVLATAFEPFGGASVNGSKAVADAIAAGDPAIELRILPVVRGEADRILIERLATGPAPAVTISLGEAEPQPVVRLEKVAINYDNFRIPDNAGNQPLDEPIRADGLAAFFATLPVSEIAEALRGTTPLPVVLSLTAGAFVCNHLAYRALDWLAAHPVCPYVFIHVPAWRPESDISLDDIVATVQTIVDALRAIRIS